MTRAFSVVIPVKDEAEMIGKNLMSWIDLNPFEIIICTDYPPASKIGKVLNSFERVANDRGVGLDVMQIPKTHGWQFHQAYVRRCGFAAAKHDVILTGDIDLNVTKECLKAVEIVGYDNVGLVSVSKKSVGGLLDQVRANVLEVARIASRFFPKYRDRTYFTGLYALYRPYWLDSEGEGIRELRNPKYAEFNALDETPYTGEDTYLRNRMKLKHKVKYLPEVGAIDVRPNLERSKGVQIRIGRKYAYDRTSIGKIVLHVCVHLRPWVLWGWMLQKVGK